MTSKNKKCKRCKAPMSGVSRNRRFCDSCNIEIKKEKQKEYKDKIRIKQKKEAGLICQICGVPLHGVKRNTKVCKKEECVSLYYKAMRRFYYYENKDKMIEYQKEYQKKNRENHRARAREYYLKNKGKKK